jgi:peptidoglycan/xylan/chitin deacetylase (PgdA/CDA1 family)
MSDLTLRTLTYHRILDRDAAANPSLVSAVPAEFDRQMRHLARNYRVVSADEVVAAVRSGRTLPDRAVLVTFDDGYRDFGDIAWPIMRKYGLPATVFVASDYPDHPERSFWWDRLYHAFSRARASSVSAGSLGLLRLDGYEARMRNLRLVQQRVKQLPHGDGMRLVDDLCRALDSEIEALPRVLTWQELRELAGDGVTIGGHTRSHAALDRLSVREVHDEVRGCHVDLARELGTAPSVFAYPFGSHDDAAVEAVRRAGFELAFTCLDGHSHLDAIDPLRLRRTNITPRTSPLIFRLRLLTIGSYIDVWRNSRKQGRSHDPIPA